LAQAVGLTRLNGRLLDSLPVHHQSNYTLTYNAPPCARANQIIVSGAAGEYGVIADHAPHVAQLKPGVLQISHEGGNDTSLQEVSLSPILIPPQ